MRKSSSVVMYHPVSVRRLALCRSVCCAAVPENALADRASKAHAGGHAQTHRNTTVQQSRYHRLLAGILLDIVSAVKYKQPIEDRGVYLGKVSDERSEHLGGLGLRSKNNAITNNIFDQQTA
ncbi:hypothetical protein E3P94_01885 [Wallemia ichthyophaga]|nr:hypothetical protein E3P95_01853 [Wallemia ichthyophaga]TIB01261.1 hypothetical protein E3P94_01885 [Wallemia ichthyophaga]